MDNDFVYDAVVIGGGISGIMACYKLINLNPDMNILMLEKGASLDERKCPLIALKGGKGGCLKCSSCAIMSGLAGAGAFSDGKYIIGTEYGGWLTEFLPQETVMKYIMEADDILVKFGATDKVYTPNDELKEECLKHDLHLLQTRLKHLGTDNNYYTMLNLINYLKAKVKILTHAKVINVDKDSHIVTFNYQNAEVSVKSDYIIFAVGRAGSKDFRMWCEKNKIVCNNNQVDLGVRVELPAVVWDKFSKKIYEPKILYRTKGYDDVVRMFCFNERGNVVMENTDGVLTINGHSYAQADKKTQNSNFALLSTSKFTQPFKEPIQYARAVASLANKISGGSVLVQRFGDLVMGRRTTAERLNACTTKPTLEAVPGDLSLCMPKRQLDNIIETIYALDKVAPGTANKDTLLYGVECKYYATRPDCEDFELKNCHNIFAIGDGAGFTRSLSHAGAHGLYIAQKIIDRKNNNLETKNEN